MLQFACIMLLGYTTYMWHGDMLIEDSCILLVVSYLLDNKIILEKVGLLKYGSMESWKYSTMHIWGGVYGVHLSTRTFVGCLMVFLTGVLKSWPNFNLSFASGRDSYHGGACTSMLLVVSLLIRFIGSLILSCEEALAGWMINYRGSVQMHCETSNQWWVLFCKFVNKMWWFLFYGNFNVSVIPLVIYMVGRDTRMWCYI